MGIHDHGYMNSWIGGQQTLILGHFQVDSYRHRSLIEGYIPYRSLMEALYALNSPPVVSFNREPGPHGAVGDCCLRRS